jgi:small conductance mechanosensitive channel
MPEEIDQLQSLVESLTQKLIDYGADPKAAISCVKEAIPQATGIDPKKTPQVGIEAFGDSSINIAYRYWVKTSDYFPIQCPVNLAVFKALKDASIAIPFPQRDVHIVPKQNANEALI